ncbi:MAG TPA: DNA-protecting protein DprA [Candidatus Scatovivens faecipullorum]|nr:DNA-protecting protein DprA [Candidatus Scatovivens faecipullorum]
MIDEYEVWLSNINISNKRKIELLKKFRTAKKIWNLDKKSLEKLDLKESEINNILENEEKRNLEKYVNYMVKHNILLVSCFSEKYPDSLKFIDNRPVFLYIRGNIENLYEDCIAIVGSRNASIYGRNVARKIAKELADRNINIVSGLAAGIDKFAHLGALESKTGKTIAVLGTGISDNEIYPFENKKLFENILESKGTIISEFKLGTKPLKYNFPLRNRIISGLSKKLIVVEAAQNSGSLITADFALEQGKDIYAVPGNITSENSVGTNELIKQGAYLFNKIDDLF